MLIYVTSTVYFQEKATGWGEGGEEEGELAQETMNENGQIVGLNFHSLDQSSNWK